ncbi:MAG: hypothetical protein U1C74_17585 [Phenylobacterium sp.]|nr:hypothetical protein [Phenylobacterium sp.]
MVAGHTLTLALGSGDRIGTVLIIRETLALLGGTAAPMALLWLAGGSALGGLEVAMVWLGFETASIGFDKIGLSYTAVSSILTGLFSAVGVRLLLRGSGGWGRLDRHVVAAVCVYAGVAFLYGLWTLALAEMFARPPRPFLGVALAILLIATLYVTVKLVLWPVALIAARLEVRAFRSWRLMRKATRGYVLAHVIFLAPFAGLLFLPGVGEGLLLPPGVLEAASLGYAILSLAATVVVYQIRVEWPAGVADVFA